jgi:hypothetical protein
MGRPFARAAQQFALIAAAVAMHGAGTVALMQAVAGMPEYRSRGKGKARRHDNGGTLAHRRAALKRRNVIRNRKACR